MIVAVVERINHSMDSIGNFYEVIVVNDGSQDATAEAACQAGATVISHPYNMGNGAAVKTGIGQQRGGLLFC
jgi:glycosyltransferase involved in cell wall biosynthesis